MSTEQLLIALTQKVDRLNKMVSDMRKERMKEEKDAVWVTANILQKRFGVNCRRLEQLRKSQVIKFKQERKGVVRYLLSSAEQYFKINTP